MSDRGQEYFIALQTAIDEERTSDIIDISSQILDFSHDDPDARLCRAIAYIHSGLFEEAFSDLNHLKGCEFEKSYCLYKLERFRESLEIIEKLPKEIKDEDRFIHLYGQVLFRLDKTSECYKIYDKLKRDQMTPEDFVNVSASYAVSNNIEKILELVSSESLPQQIYNTTLALIDNGRTEKAKEFLEKGFSLIENKKSLIGQLFLILQAIINIGITSESYDSKQALLTLAEDEQTNSYARSIAAYNFSTLESSTEHYSISKKLRHLFSDFVKTSIYRKKEIEAFLINNFLISLKIGESKKVLYFTEKADQLTFINPIIAESFKRTFEPSKAPYTKFTFLFEAQNLISESKYLEAAKILMNCPFSKNPRCIVVICDLLYLSNNYSLIIEYLKQNENDSVEFLEFAINISLKINYPQESSRWAEKLVKITSNSSWAISLLIISYSHHDIEMAERYAQRIKFETINDEQINKIEETPLNVLITIAENEKPINNNNYQNEIQPTFETKKRRKRTKGEMSPDKLKKYKLKHKRRRRLQKPKNYDPQRVPDPERWIRKNQRSAAKNRKKNKNQIPPKAPVKGGKIIEQPKPQAPPPQQQQSQNKNKSNKNKKGGGKKKW